MFKISQSKLAGLLTPKDLEVRLTLTARKVEIRILVRLFYILHYSHGCNNGEWMRPRLNTTPLKSKQHTTLGCSKGSSTHPSSGKAQPAEPEMHGQPSTLQGSDDSTPDRCMKRSPSSVMSTSSVLGTCRLSRFSMKSQSRTELKNLTVPSELSCFRGFSGSASRPSG